MASHSAPSSTVPAYTKCSKESCKKKEPITVQCKACHSAFCMEHRNPLDHDCTTRIDVNTKQMTKLELALWEKQEMNKKKGVVDKGKELEQVTQASEFMKLAKQRDLVSDLDADKHQEKDKEKEEAAKREKEQREKEEERERETQLAKCLRIANTPATPLGDSKSIPQEHRFTLLIYFPLTSGLEAKYISINNKFTTGKMMDYVETYQPQLAKLHALSQGENGRFFCYVVREKTSINMLPHTTSLMDLGEFYVRDMDKIVIELESPIPSIWMRLVSPEFGKHIAPAPSVSSVAEESSAHVTKKTTFTGKMKRGLSHQNSKTSDSTKSGEQSTKNCIIS